MSGHEHYDRRGDLGRGRFAGLQVLTPQEPEPLDMPPRFGELVNPSLAINTPTVQEVTIVDNLATSRFGISPETSSILQWATAATVAFVDKHSVESTDWRQTAIALALSGIAYLVSTSNKRYWNEDTS